MDFAVFRRGVHASSASPLLGAFCPPSKPHARQRSHHHGTRLGFHARFISLSLYSPLYSRGAYAVGVRFFGRCPFSSTSSRPSRDPSTQREFHPRITFDPEMYTQPSVAACCSLVKAALALLRFIFTVKHQFSGKCGRY